MSTSFTVFQDGEREVCITERSALFDMNLYDYPPLVDTSGPQQMGPKEALDLAAGIIYAVWCSYPIEADAMVDELGAIPYKWGQIVGERV